MKEPEQFNFNAEAITDKTSPEHRSALAPAFEDLEFVQDVPSSTVSEYRDTTTGETYFLLREVPATQEFVSKLLKGILPVSDIVHVQNAEGKTMHFSKKMSLDDFNKVEGFEDALLADLHFLEVIFNMDDLLLDGIMTGNNIDTKKQVYTLFDFELARYHFYGHASFLNDLQYVTLGLRSLIRQRTETLLQRVEGKDGLVFITSLWEHVSGPHVVGRLFTGIDTPEEFQATLVDRLHKVISKLAELERADE